MTTNGSGPSNESGVIRSVAREGRLFPAPPGFVARARLGDPAEYQRLYRRSVDDPQGFWGEQAAAELTWSKPFTQVMTGEVPWTKWFEDGELNLSTNCLDRHLNTPTANQAALIWEGEPAALDRLLAYLREGPGLAHVTNVQVEWLPPAGLPRPFEVRKTF